MSIFMSRQTDRQFSHKHGLFSRLKPAFTLAEVLITLAIVGVIAALTIPNLVSNISNAQELTQLKKVYGELNAAFMAVQYDNSGIESVFGNAMDGGSQSMNIFATKMNVINNCGLGAGCLYTTPFYLRVGLSTVANFEGAFPSCAKVVLADGSMMVLKNYANSCTSNYGTGPLLNSVCGVIYIDVNGSRSPNVGGQDVFEFWITKTGIQPFGANGEALSSCPAGGRGYAGCTATLLQGL